MTGCGYRSGTRTDIQVATDDNPYDHPYVTVHQSNAVPKGTGIRFGDKLFLNPADAAQLRKEAMSNDEYKSTFGSDPQPTKRELKRAARKAKLAAIPKWRRVVGGIVGVLLLFVVVASCSAIVNSTNERTACIERIAQEDGYDQAIMARDLGECD